MINLLGEVRLDWWIVSEIGKVVGFIGDGLKGFNYFGLEDILCEVNVCIL